MPFEYHHHLGTQPEPLRDDGVLIIGSGNVVHHLGRVGWSQSDHEFDWAHRFNDDVAGVGDDDRRVDFAVPLVTERSARSGRVFSARVRRGETLA